MRTRILIPVTAIAAVMLVVLSVVITATPGTAGDRDEQRISDLATKVADLETRVAALETRVAATAPPSDTSSQSNRVVNVGNSSSQTSVTASNVNNNNTYTGSFSSNGDQALPFDLDDAGTYHLTITAPEPVTVRIETAGGEPVPALSLETGSGGASSVSGQLDAGSYVLRVTATTQWSVLITSAGS